MNKAHCQALDSADSLSLLRDLFALPEGVIYLDGNSLGARPKSALATAQHVITQQWGNDLIRSWNTAGWFQLPQTLGNRLAPIIGAGQDEVVVTDTISLNVFKALAALLKRQPDQTRKQIVSERQNFPTDLYMAQGLIELKDAGYELILADNPEQLLTLLNNNTAVLMLSHVNYHTGLMHDMQVITAAAHAAGALMLWDLAHSAGAVPVDLTASGADAAVGCTYKYLNAGPGAPAFIWLHPKHLTQDTTFLQPLSGWWGHKAPFAMTPQYQPAHGISQFLCGTQGIVSMAMVADGLAIFEQASMSAIRAKSLALTDLFIALVDERAAEFGLSLLTPRAHGVRGSQVSLCHANAFAIMQALIDCGVIGDFRAPDVLRFGFTPLYTRFVDVYDAAQILFEILISKAWQAPKYQVKGLVT